MYNRQRFYEANFGQNNRGRENPSYPEVYQDPIISESVIWNQHINKNQANWMQVTFDSAIVEDEVSFVNLAQLNTTSEFGFNSVTMGSLGLSYSDDFEGYYKIAGFTLFRNSDRLKIQRDAYDFVTWIGDVGGLLDGLTFFGFVIVNLIFVRKWNITAFIMERLYVSERNQEGIYDIQKPPNHHITADGLVAGRKFGSESINMLSTQICDKIKSRNEVRQMNCFQRIYQRLMCCSTERRVKLQVALQRDSRARLSI